MSKSPTYFVVNPFPVSVGIFTSEKQLKHEVKRLGLSVQNAPNLEWKPYGGRVVRLDNVETDATLLWVMIDAKGLSEEDPDTRVGIYAHEATHVHQFLMDSIGEEEPGAEIEAYCIGHITEQIFTTLENALVKFRH